MGNFNDINQKRKRIQDLLQGSEQIALDEQSCNFFRQINDSLSVLSADYKAIEEGNMALYTAEIESLEKTYDLLFTHQTVSDMQKGLTDYYTYSSEKYAELQEKQSLYVAMGMLGVGLGVAFACATLLIPGVTVTIAAVLISVGVLMSLTSLFGAVVKLSDSIHESQLPETMKILANTGFKFFNMQPPEDPIIRNMNYMALAAGYRVV